MAVVEREHDGAQAAGDARQDMELGGTLGDSNTTDDVAPVHAAVTCEHGE